MTKSVMVLNHSEEILALMKEILEDSDYKVVLGAVEPKIAAEVPKIRPDLIIVDQIVSLAFDGIQLIQLFKLQKNTANIPVILCTAAANIVEKNIEQLNSLKVRVLLKPFNIEDFLSAVEAEIGPAD